jgi:uncharacterized membrane protein YjdF
MRTTWLLIALAALLALLALSGFRPHDRGTWALEVAPIVIALPILWTTPLLLMSRVHDRQIRALQCYPASSPGPAR